MTSFLPKMAALNNRALPPQSWKGGVRSRDMAWKRARCLECEQERKKPAPGEDRAGFEKGGLFGRRKPAKYFYIDLSGGIPALLPHGSHALLHGCLTC
ncbi:hypothetical protein NDN16_02485 [Aureimonas altamirensis]|uniref:hypothetical protein n=1 Tax=Aureimonas altamirensis TaxID=370622 RepID=UPI002036B89E|nr:hypothetical protein [Aureimonas altamirensis]MCM2502537.1 hypothetical protein [Aureimonas altamirensis]